MYQIITSYPLNLHNVTCQLYLNNAREKHYSRLRTEGEWREKNLIL